MTDIPNGFLRMPNSPTTRRQLEALRQEWVGQLQRTRWGINSGWMLETARRGENNRPIIASQFDASALLRHHDGDKFKSWGDKIKRLGLL